MSATTVVNVDGVILRADMIGPGVAEFLLMAAIETVKNMPAIEEAFSDLVVFGSARMMIGDDARAVVLH